MPDDAPATVASRREAAQARTREGAGWLCCRVCGARVAPARARTSFDGGHTHRFTNPHGLTFAIGLFDAAPGCRHAGPETEYFSWFPGYAWRVALCRACGRHLGWAFACIGPPGVGEPEGFHGLVLSRIEAESRPP